MDEQLNHAAAGHRGSNSFVETPAFARFQRAIELDLEQIVWRWSHWSVPRAQRQLAISLLETKPRFHRKRRPR